MNVERILKLADVIEAQPHASMYEKRGFNMSHYSHFCGTPSCIAGWAVYKFENDGRELGAGTGNRAMRALDISAEQKNDLFGPIALDWNEITPQHAAAVLRHLAATGNVDWSVG